MLAEGAAWVVVGLHMGYLLYAVFGGFLGLLGRRWMWAHLVSSAWSITVTASALTCPLTAIEKRLIMSAGGTPYDGTFIDQYLEGTVYPVGYDAHVWFGGAAVALTSYAVLLARHLRSRPAEPAGA